MLQDYTKFMAPQVELTPKVLPFIFGAAQCKELALND
jgi:hypothetical protein